MIPHSHTHTICWMHNDGPQCQYARLFAAHSIVDVLEPCRVCTAYYDTYRKVGIHCLSNTYSICDISTTVYESFVLTIVPMWLIAHEPCFYSIVISSRSKGKDCRRRMKCFVYMCVSVPYQSYFHGDILLHPH